MRESVVDLREHFDDDAAVLARRAFVLFGAIGFSRGFPVSADRVFITAGTSEGIELALSALIDEGGEVLVPMPTLSAPA